MVEDTIQIRRHINKRLYGAVQGVILKEQLTNKDISITGVIEKQLFEFVAESGLLSDELLEELKKGLNL